MSQYGDPLAKIGPPSNGPGSGGGIGSGSGGGVGSGKGGGFGPGEGGGVGGGVFRVGGGVTAPALLFKKEPEYSEEARKAKYQGTVLLYIEVDPSGKATNMKVSPQPRPRTRREGDGGGPAVEVQARLQGRQARHRGRDDRSQFPAAVDFDSLKFCGKGDPGDRVAFFHLAAAFRAGADLAEMVEGVDAGVVAVAPARSESRSCRPARRRASSARA